MLTFFGTKSNATHEKKTIQPSWLPASFLEKAELSLHCIHPAPDPLHCCTHRDQCYLVLITLPATVQSELFVKCQPPRGQGLWCGLLINCTHQCEAAVWTGTAWWANSKAHSFSQAWQIFLPTNHVLLGIQTKARHIVICAITITSVGLPLPQHKHFGDRVSELYLKVDFIKQTGLQVGRVDMTTVNDVGHVSHTKRSKNWSDIFLKQFLRWGYFCICT